MNKVKVSQLVKSIYHVLDNPAFNKDFLTQGQISSKEWLINELLDLDLKLGTVFICAGWYGSLATLMFESDLKLEKIRSFDIDSSCESIAETINRPWVIDDWKFKASTVDILKIEYPTTYVTKKRNGDDVQLTEMPDTIINTSCEHIYEFNEWYSRIPSDKLVIVQSNDYWEIEEHVNCSDTLEDFAKITPMRETLYQGTLELTRYKRFMRIGYK